MPIGRVQQLHLAGHSDYGTHMIDTHDQPIVSSVWDLYAAAVKRFGRVSTLIERDDNIICIAISNTNSYSSVRKIPDRVIVLVNN